MLKRVVIFTLVTTLSLPLTGFTNASAQEDTTAVTEPPPPTTTTTTTTITTTTTTTPSTIPPETTTTTTTLLPGEEPPPPPPDTVPEREPDEPHGPPAPPAPRDIPGYTGGGTIKGDASPRPVENLDPNSDEVPFGEVPRVGGEEVARKAEATIAAAQATVDQADTSVKNARIQIAELEQSLLLVDRQFIEAYRLNGQAVLNLERTREQLQLRAVAAYIAGGQDAHITEAIFTAEDFTEAERRMSYSSAVNEYDNELADAYTAAKKAATTQIQKIVEERKVLQMKLSEAKTTLDSNQIVLQAARTDFESVVGLQINASFDADGSVPGVSSAVRASNGLAFPIAGPFTFIDSWGFNRSGGRYHKGADIFSPYGTPLVAIEDGYLSEIGSNSLGGLKLWVLGDSGNSYYYAHLAGFAEGISNNMRVRTGDLIGYVGDSGNAQGTPPHLHIEVHPNGISAVNPYPLLASIARSLPNQ